MWLLNTDWLKDWAKEDEVKKAMDALCAYRRPEVLKAIAFLWGTFLVLVFSLIVTVRFALWLPL